MGNLPGLSRAEPTDAVVFTGLPVARIQDMRGARRNPEPSSCEDSYWATVLHRASGIGERLRPVNASLAR